MQSITGYTQEAGKSQAGVWRQLFVFIANTVAAMGGVISILIRGLSLSLGVLWNALQVV